MRRRAVSTTTRTVHQRVGLVASIAPDLLPIVTPVKRVPKTRLTSQSAETRMGHRRWPPLPSVQTVARRQVGATANLHPSVTAHGVARDRTLAADCRIDGWRVGRCRIRPVFNRYRLLQRTGRSRDRTMRWRVGCRTANRRGRLRRISSAM
jgi:hypothetical protein